MSRLANVDAVVIGGGLAGAATAYALAKRALTVSLLESRATLGAKASGNSRGILMPYIATDSSPPGRLYATGFNFSHALLTGELSRHNLFTQCGALQLPSTKRIARLLTEEVNCIGGIPVSRVNIEDGSEIAGIQLPSPAFFMPTGGECRPDRITHVLATEGGAHLNAYCEKTVVDIRSCASTWKVTLQDGETITTPLVVLCGAYEIANLPLTSWIPLEAIRGQTALVRADSVSARLRSVIACDGYITPNEDGTHFVGAHYRHDDMNDEPSAADTNEILSRLTRSLPAISCSDVVAARVCFRASTHDRMPYIGLLPSAVGARLYINAGHGSRGVTTAPLGGEILARLITGEPLNDLADAAQIANAQRLRSRLPT